MTAKETNEITHAWEGTYRKNKRLKGEMKASGEAFVKATKQHFKTGSKLTDKNMTLFIRQLASITKAGVPLLQPFDIVGKGHSNPAVSKLLGDIKTNVETGSSLSWAFRKYPFYFDNLFCNLVMAGEQAGILDSLLDRLATYKKKILSIKEKIKSILFYPVSIIVVAFVITAVITIFVIPAFKELSAVSAPTCTSPP